ncbi:MAG TPA: Ku protein [Pyrinomonadaceae bacterium]|nr:Ku protein [Pyrinomonadaceae bacterium]
MEAEEENAGGRPFWSGTLTFGLVSVPVSLFPAQRSTRTSLRMLGPDGQPLARKYYAEKTGKDLDADEVVRGYEIDQEKYVIVTDEELERLAPEKTRDIDLKQFVAADSIPPIYFERGYFLTPAAGSQKAYKLLAETMEKSGLAGIATFVMRGKEYLVAIFSEKGILRAETMRFADELRSPSDIGLPKKKEAPKATVHKFEKLISTRAKKQFSPSKLEDKQTESLLKLVKKKQANRANIVKVEEEADTDHKVVDLVAILKKSLGAKR